MLLHSRDVERKTSQMMEKGPLRAIWVKKDWSREADGQQGTAASTAFRALRGRVGGLRELDFLLDGTVPLRRLWDLWNTEEFSLTDLRLANDSARGFQLNDIHRYTSLPSPPPLQLDISSITTPILNNLFHANGSSLLPLLRRIPNLRHLQIDQSSTDLSLPSASPSDPTQVQLPNLLAIVFSGYAYIEALRHQELIIFLLPKLQELTLHGGEIPIELLLFPPSPHLPNIHNLRTLDLSSSSIPSEPIFLDQLARLRSLEELNISGTNLTDATLERLVWPKDEVAELGGGGKGEGICPRLDMLTLTGGLDQPSTSAGALIRMVVSRGRSSLVGGGCVLIETLRVEGDSEGLDGMEKMVLRGLVGRSLIEE